MNAVHAGVKLFAAFRVTFDDHSPSMWLRLAAQVFVERVFAAQAVLLAA
jgi:hypothetical protein